MTQVPMETIPACFTAHELVTVQPMAGPVGRLTQQRIVVFIGPDMCGKTEIARALSVAVGIPYWKYDREWDAFKDDPTRFARTVRYGDEYLASFLRASGASMVKDRGYPCEWVYSRAMGRARDDAAVWHADARYAALGADLVLCTRTSYAGIRDDRFPDELGPARLMQIDGLYREFVETTGCRVTRLTVDDEDLGRQIADLRAALVL